MANTSGWFEPATEKDRFESGRLTPVEPMLSTLLRAMGRTA